MCYVTTLNEEWGVQAWFNEVDVNTIHSVKVIGCTVICNLRKCTAVTENLKNEFGNHHSITSIHVACSSLLTDSKLLASLPYWISSTYKWAILVLQLERKEHHVYQKIHKAGAKVPSPRVIKEYIIYSSRLFLVMVVGWVGGSPTIPYSQNVCENVIHVCSLADGTQSSEGKLYYIA